MKDKTCCFTGHRKIPLDEYKTISEKTEKTINSLIERGYRYFGVGGALGFDTVVALKVLELRKFHNDIKLILVLPCVSQAKKWSLKDIEVYNKIKQEADKVVYISYEYTKECMHNRNRHLVDNSSICVCYLKEKNGGTAYTVNYAIAKKLEIINLAELN